MENENMLKNINFPLDFVGENSAWIDELTGLATNYINFSILELIVGIGIGADYPVRKINIETRKRS